VVEQDVAVRKTGLQLREEALPSAGAVAVHDLESAGPCNVAPVSWLRSGCPSCGFEPALKESVVTDLEGKATKQDAMMVKMVYDSLVRGGGFAGLSDMIFNLGLRAVSSVVYSRYCSCLYAQTKILWERHTLKLAATMERVLPSSGVAPFADGCLEVAVSYDGSWMARGHRSHVGVGFVMEIERGLVLDVEVISTFARSV
jgi:hypothetical protein